LNLPLDVPNVPAFGREPFKHEIKILGKNVAYDDKYRLNTQSGTQWDGFRHIAHFPSETFFNGTKGKDIEGNTKEDKNKCGIHHWAEHGIAGRGVLIDYVGVGGKPLSYLRLFHEIFLRQCPLPKQSQLSNC
jgi:hypothetical protein